MNPRVSLACAALVITAFSTSGCEAVIADELESAANDPELREVQDRFESMEEIHGKTHGQTVIETPHTGTLWLLTRRASLPHVGPQDCTIGELPLGEPSENLNIPEPQSLDAEGRRQTHFAFAAVEVPESGTYELECDLDAETLILLMEPDS